MSISIANHVLLLLAGFGNITPVEIEETCGSTVQTRITRDKGKFQQYIIKFLPLKKSTLKEVKMNIYVGNLDWGVTEEDLKTAFEEFGQVTSAKIVTDRYSGKSRGFGFVEMPEETEAKAAISALNSKDLKGRAIKVNEAKPRRDDRGGFGGGNRY